MKNEQKYYDKYVTLTENAAHSTRKPDWKYWDCFYLGEKIGKIEYESDYRQSYSVSYKYGDRINDGYLGRFNSLAEAKREMLKNLPDDLFEKKNRKKLTASVLPMYDMEFYPTPEWLAGALLKGVDSNVKSILEPSAGKGDLMDCAKNFFMKNMYRYGRDDKGFKSNCDVVELDPNLQSVLKGKGYRLVGDDFLSYYSRKHYDLIIMNPPFSNGDEHLLHALDLCEDGGQVACILNAETLRNPCTNIRKMLIKRLREYNATIRYIHDGFRKAERKARVDVALINVKVPSTFSDDTVWQNLKKASETQFEQEQQKYLASSDNIERLLTEYGMIVSGGMELFKVYNGIAPHLCRGNDATRSSYITLRAGGEISLTHVDSATVNSFLQNVRLDYWNQLLDIPEIRNQMTSDMRDKYSKTIDKMKDYEFSEFNIRQVMQEIQGGILEGIDQAIIKCFDKLADEHAYNENVQNENIHYFNGWKTNKSYYVNKKVIIPTWGAFATDYKADKYGRWKSVYSNIDPRSCFNILHDLEMALNYLDKGETTSIDMNSVLESAAKAERTNVDCKYFNVRFYKKGTAHITFNDQKIVDRLNIYVGRKRAWLPPTYGKAKYSEMDAESRKVVDEFQGKDKYEEVFGNVQDYIIENNQAMLRLA